LKNLFNRLSPIWKAAICTAAVLISLTAFVMGVGYLLQDYFIAIFIVILTEIAFGIGLAFWIKFEKETL